ncbi:MAG: hypothetical protein LBU27_00960 [Candidatus Peribacteria bacterium]|nr:hypothetical protein [Candidatus Peribacteria bacterium]
MMEEKQLDWVAIIRNIVIGLLAIAGIIRLWNDITAREASADTTYRLHWVFAALYNYL